MSLRHIIIYWHNIFGFFHFIVIFPSENGHFIYIIVFCFWFTTCMSLYTYLTYATEQIWLPHCKYDSHSQYAKLAYRCSIFAYILQNTTNCNSYFTHNGQICTRKKYAPNMPHMPSSSCKHETAISVHMSYEVTAIINVTTSTGIHTFHITGICLWAICLPHCSGMLHCTTTVVYIGTLLYCIYK